MRIFKTKEYRIASVSGKLLTAAEDGTVTVEEQDSQKAQRWKFIPTDGAYRICNLQHQKMLDIIAGGTVNGAWVHLWDEVEAASQLWTCGNRRGSDAAALGFQRQISGRHPAGQRPCADLGKGG